jgi:hypothetical protein
MQRQSGVATAVESVARQAAEVVDGAVRRAMIDSQRAARVCGCRACRARSARVAIWGAVMLMAGPAPDDR